MKRYKAKTYSPIATPMPDMPPPQPPSQSIAGVNMDVCAKAEERPRNKAAALVKFEALYLALRESDVYIKWDVREAFMTAFAAALTEMRLGSEGLR